MADIRQKIALKFLEQGYGSMDSWEARRIVIALLSEEPLPDAWREHTKADPLPDGCHWFFWRDPSEPDDVHVDEALFTDREIDGKAGCGLAYFTECQPCRLPADVLAALARAEK